MYPACFQELPAAHTVATLYRLFTHHGSAPYTNAPPTQVYATLPNAAQWIATEGGRATVERMSEGDRSSVACQARRRRDELHD